MTTRSILIEHSGGSATIVEGIPANAKITFGAVQPGKNNYGSENVLRIYTSLSNQLACFRNVASFRDLSLSIRVREITEEMEATEVTGPAGSRRSSSGSTTGRFVTPEAF